MRRRIGEPAWRAQNIHQVPPPQRVILDDIGWFYFPIGFVSLILLVFVARGARAVNRPGVPTPIGVLSS